MSTKKLIVMSLIFVLAGFFLTGYVFAEAEREMPDSLELAKLKEEHDLLKERVVLLEKALLITPPDGEDIIDKPNNEPVEKPEPPKEPEVNKVMVAYVKDEYNGVNTRTAPGTNNPLVERVEPKTPMIIMDQEDDWYRVKLESGNIAWVASWVVRVQEE